MKCRRCGLEDYGKQHTTDDCLQALGAESEKLRKELEDVKAQSSKLEQDLRTRRPL